MEYFKSLELKSLVERLENHQIYSCLDSLQNIRIFMQHHVFAVWDFMTLLKFLQSEISPSNFPWYPSKYPSQMVRLINEIVLGEESDYDLDLRAISHFELYIEAMYEINADSTLINNFLETKDVSLIPQPAQDFVQHTLSLVNSKSLIAVASSFFHGREKLLPNVFRRIIKTIEESSLETPKLIYYFERHVDIDENEHGPMAESFLSNLINDFNFEQDLALEAAKKSLEQRLKLWDALFIKMHPHIATL